MSEFRALTLSEISDIKISNVDKKSVSGERDVVLCNYMDVYSNDYITAKLDFMQATASRVEIEKFKVEDGDVLITKDSETPYDIGVPSVVLESIENLVCAYHLALIKPDRTYVNPVFLSKQLAQPETEIYFSRYAAGSTRYGLSNKAIANTPLRLPSLGSQNKIARILQTIDRAIEKTEALIDKYQQIKAGLMHDLFTRGIGPDGQLRPPREQAPELYQETPIGWIPKEWGWEPLESLLAPVPNNIRSGPFGSSLLKSELVENGIPFLGIDNIHVEKFVDDFRRHVSEKKFLELSRYAVRARDVVITIMGTVGRSAVVPDDIGRALSSKHLWTMTFDSEVVVPELVCWQLNYAPWVKSWFRKETQGGIMDAIQSQTLRTIVLPVIPMEEQDRIFRRYITINNAIASEEKKLRKLCKEKSGLMHDLLTGKVPIQVEPEEEPEAAHV